MWQLTTIDTAAIEFMDQGSGTPVTFVHGGMAEECRAIVNEPSITPFRVIHFHRRGYGRSSLPELPVSIERNAADCIELLRQRSVSHTHLIGAIIRRRDCITDRKGRTGASAVAHSAGTYAAVSNTQLP